MLNDSIEPEINLPVETKSPLKEFINIQAIYADSLESYKDYFDDDLSLAQNVQNIIKQSVLVPNPNTQYPLMTGYALLPTHLSLVLPIAFCFGSEGSGKSTYSILVSRIRGINHIFSPGDTFASARNLIQSMRFYDESCDYEKPNSAMVWDNLNIDLLKGNDKLYNVILSGYNRSSATVRIATPGGGNIEFDVFCPKVFSSVEPIHQDSTLRELARRLIIFYHLPLNRISLKDKQSLEFDVDDLIDIDSLDFSGLGNDFVRFWELKENIDYFISLRKSLGKVRNKLVKIPSGFDRAKRSMVIDLICTMTVTGLVDTPQSAMDLIASHFEWIDEVSCATSVIKKMLDTWCNERLSKQNQTNELLVQNGYEPTEVLSIPSKDIKAIVESWHKDGSIDILPTMKNIRPVMESLGFKYQGSNFSK